MKKQILIVGLGRFGCSVANALFELGNEILAIDKDPKNLNCLPPQITHVVEADATNEAVLKEIGATTFDMAIVTIGSEIENSVLATLLLKKLGVRYVIARASSELHGTILEKLGADKVVNPERDMGERIAHEITMGEISDYISLGANYGVGKVIAPEYLYGKSLNDLGLAPEGKSKQAVLLIQREGEGLVAPSKGEIIKEGDTLIIAGNANQLEKLLLDAKKTAVPKPEKSGKGEFDQVGAEREN